MTHEHDTGQGHHNPSNPQSNTSVDYKLTTGKDESFSPEVMTNENTTAPSGGASLGAHVSETNQASSRPSRTVDKILGAHPVNDDFWDNTNPTDVPIDTVNSEGKMAGIHITEFHKHDDEQPVIADLLSQEDQEYDN